MFHPHAIPFIVTLFYSHAQNDFSSLETEVLNIRFRKILVIYFLIEVINFQLFIGQRPTSSLYSVFLMVHTHPHLHKYI